MSVVELEVRMEGDGCEKKVRKALSDLEGVQTIEIDIAEQKVTVSGYVDQMAVLNAVRSTGKRAEFWPHPYNSEYHPDVPRFFQDYNQYSGSSSTSQVSTYSSGIHGFSSSVQGDYQSQLPPISSTILMDEKTTSFFSDENPHACSLM